MLPKNQQGNLLLVIVLKKSFLKNPTWCQKQKMKEAGQKTKAKMRAKHGRNDASETERAVIQPQIIKKFHNLPWRCADHILNIHTRKANKRNRISIK